MLLPQGKFDRLLTATGGPRTALLKSIFGVQAIETMRTRAGDYRERLTELIHQADLARRNLLDDPAAGAVMAARDAAQAERAAQHFHEALGALRACQQRASAARDRHAELAAASDILEHQETRDVAGELPQISAAAAELAVLDAQAANAKQDRETRRAATRAELAAAAREGLTLESLVSAATLLDRLPGRLDTLSADQAQLDRDAEDISGQARQLETAGAALVNLRARASSLAEKRDHASAALEEYRRACGLVQDAAGTALRSAIDAGHARRDEQAAFDQMQDLQDAIVPLEGAAGTAVRNLQSAEDHLAIIRSHDAAHTAGTGLSAGQPCLICHRPLPDDYQPPASADPAALQAADRSVKEARKADREAAEELADARGRADRRRTRTREAPVSDSGCPGPA